MSGKRIEIVTECPHGLDRKHPTNFWDGLQIDCPGGSRRFLTEGQYVLIKKVNGEWPESALTAAEPFEVFVAEDGHNGLRGKFPSDVLDALSDHTEGTP